MKIQRSAKRILFKISENNGDNATQIGHNIDIPKTPHAIATLIEIGSPSCINFYSFAVLTTIKLNNELCLLANEVRDIKANRLLPPEFIAVQLAVAQMRPELAFSVG